MTTRLNLILGCLLAIAAFATTAASASAFSWWIETEGGGEEILKSGVKAPFDKAMTGSSTLVLPWSGTNEVRCTTGSYEEGFIEGAVGLGAKAVIWEGCSVLKPSGCTIEGASIKTTELTGSIKQVGAAVEFQIKPVVGTLFAEFKVLGSCSLKGTQQARGSIGGTLTKPKELTKEKTFEIEPAHSSLKVAEASASPAGGDGYSATKGWSAR